MDSFVVEYDRLAKSDTTKPREKVDDRDDKAEATREIVIIETAIVKIPASHFILLQDRLSNRIIVHLTVTL
jgi:hypothetical protein